MAAGAGRLLPRRQAQADGRGRLVAQLQVCGRWRPQVYRGGRQVVARQEGDGGGWLEARVRLGAGAAAPAARVRRVCRAGILGLKIVAGRGQDESLAAQGATKRSVSRMPQRCARATRLRRPSCVGRADLPRRSRRGRRWRLT